MRIAATCGVLLAVAALAAGCGDSRAWMQRVASQASAEFGNGHPTRVVDLGPAQLVDGVQAEVLEAQGRFRFAPHCPFGGHCPRFVHFDTVQVVVDTGTHRAITMGNDTDRAELAAVAEARAASPTFRIFPRFAELPVRCRIPAASGHTIAGTCWSGWAPLPTPSFLRRVAFIEHWTPESGARATGGWILDLDRSGHVVGTKIYGRTPPQFRCHPCHQTSIPTPGMIGARMIPSARRASGLFRTFLAQAGTKPCRIRNLPASCTSKVLDFGMPPNRAVRIGFLERWHDGHHPRKGGWAVTLLPDGRVLSVHVTGATPPQLWK